LPAPLLLFRFTAPDQVDACGPDGDLWHGPLADLPARAGDARLVLVAPGETLALHCVTPPGRHRSTWMRAIPYALEEHLVDEVEALHFAFGATLDGGRLPVAVIAHDTLRGWLAACAAVGITVHAVIPDLLLLPWHEDDWSLLRDGTRLLVRTGRWEGFVTDAEALELLLGAALAEAGDSQPRGLRLWNADTLPAAVLALLDGAGITLQAEEAPPATLSLFAAAYQPGAVINLLQGPYSHQAPWRRWIRPWRTAAALAAVSVESGRTWLVLGDMRELGPLADALHAQSGREARAAGFERLYGLGEHSAAAVQAFGPGAVHFATVEALVAALEHDLQDDGPAPLVLIKGSRGMRMERVVAALAVTDAGRAVQGDH
jgi:type II secretory pathway component PulL